MRGRQRDRRARLFELEAQAEQVGHAARLQILHDARAVHLDRARTDAEFLGDLAIVLAVGDALEHLEFARGQSRQPRGDLLAVARLRHAALVAGERDRHGVEQLVFVDRLFEEVDRAVAQGAACGRHVAVAGNHDHGQAGVALLEPPLQGQAVDPRQPHVDQRAGGAQQRIELQEVLRAFVAARRVAAQPQQ